MKLSTCLTSLVLLAASVRANTPIPQSVLDAQGLKPFILGARPLWEFGVPSRGLCPTRSAPCYPDFAVDPNTLEQHAGAPLYAWPDANRGCRFPSDNGQAGGIRGQVFPTYYVANQCNPDEVRVGYWLYYPKDGFVGAGHAHDWEYYIVVWRRDGSNNFYRDRHILSYHSGRTGTPWNSVKDTVNDNLENESHGDHSKIYIGWSKHPMFDTKKTTVCDILLQSTLSAYRSDDWWYFPTESDLVQADASTRIGKAIDDIGRAGNWGSADSWPAARGAELCALEATQDGKLVALAEQRLDAQLAAGDLSLADWLPFGLLGNATSVVEDDAGEVQVLNVPVTEQAETAQRKRKYYEPRGCAAPREDL